MERQSIERDEMNENILEEYWKNKRGRCRN